MNKDEQPASGKSVGGKARWANLSAEERKAASDKMVAARAARRAELKDIPTAEFVGELKLTDDIVIPVAVLPDGRRIMSERGLTKAFGAKRGGSHWKRLRKAEEEGSDAEIPKLIVLSATNIQPFVPEAVMEGLNERIAYRTPDGATKDFGIDAALLPKICNSLLKVRDNKAGHPSQDAIIATADIIMRALAEVGITALIDEATGYQAYRQKDELATIVRKFIARELQPWVKTFPPSFFQQLCRLYNVPYPTVGNKYPQYFGTVINNHIYARLAPNLLTELKKSASKEERKARLHQHLSREIGHPTLRTHIEKVEMLYGLADNIEQANALLDRAMPRFNQNLELNL
jgi:hypothetical protein